MNRDIALGTVTLAVAVGYYLMAVALPETRLADAVGPDGLPKAYAVLLASLSLILIVSALVRRRLAPAAAIGAAAEKIAPLPGPDAPAAPRRTGWRIAGMLMIGALYVAIVPLLGYILSLTGLIVATIYLQGGAVTRQAALVAISGAVFFWLLFVFVLQVPHPPGLWPHLF